MNLLSLTFLLGAAFAAPAIQGFGAGPRPLHHRPGIDGWMSQWYGALPSTCDALPSVPAETAASSPFKTRVGARQFAALARLARELCDRAADSPSPDLKEPRVMIPAGALTFSAELKAPFSYEPPNWIVVHRATAQGNARHDVEFWPADPRDLPGSPAHGPYIVLSQWVPDGRRTNAVSFRVGLDGDVEPMAWLLDASGGAHAAVARADVRRRLQEELEFWASRQP